MPISSASRPAPAKNILRLRIRLLDIEPQIWRRIEIRAEKSFWDLHVALQNAMGWTDSHLHDFEFPTADVRKPTWIGMPNVEDMRDVLDEAQQRLDVWIQSKGETFFYKYDYGDRWRHEVVVEAVEPAPRGVRFPRCTGGERACPPEDVGGPWRYADFLQAIADPAHPEHTMFLEWCGGGFDPEDFDPKDVRFESPSRRYREVYGDW